MKKVVVFRTQDWLLTFRDVVRFSNIQGGGADSNVVSIICPPWLI